MSGEGSVESQIDYTVVQRYFEAAGAGAAAAASYMAHEQNLPDHAVWYRLRKEIETITDWLDAVPRSGKVLDVGCGGGTWTQIFANRYDAVVGMEQSSTMLKAAQQRLGHLSNVQLLAGDVRTELPHGQFDLVFLGGVSMYLNDLDVIAVLRSLKGRLTWVLVGRQRR